MTTRATSGSRAELRESIRIELDATRTAFQALLGSLTDADWNRKSGNPAWTIGEVMVHVTVIARMMPRAVAAVRKGGEMMNLPPFVLDRAQIHYVRWIARNKTRRAISQAYDAAHALILSSLQRVRDDEWQRGGGVYGRYVTVEGLFRNHINHFSEHAEHVRQGLKRR